MQDSLLFGAKIMTVDLRSTHRNFRNPEMAFLLALAGLRARHPGFCFFMPSLPFGRLDPLP